MRKNITYLQMKIALLEGALSPEVASIATRDFGVVTARLSDHELCKVLKLRELLAKLVAALAR